MKLVSITIIVLAGIASSAAFAGLPRTAQASKIANRNSSGGHDSTLDGVTPTRRETLEYWFVGAAAAVGFLASPQEATAFSNKISTKYDDRPKQRGPKPQALGVVMRKDMLGDEYLGLKSCGYSPNCFCSTDSIEDSAETNIPPFKWPTDKFTSREDAFEQLYDVVNAYQPGQSNIDGGGFDIVTYDSKTGYIYVQYQSLKNGYIDDLELAVVGNEKESNAVQVRSSSRLGYLDYGVNAKRINYLAKALRAKGWDAPGVGLETHKGYADENNIKSF